MTRNGATENSVVEQLANGVRVRIGSADRTIPRGQHTYVIRYRTTRQIGFFADYDELYWNVTGTGWTFPIDMAEARITLPEKVPFRQTAVYTGPQGARGKDATIVEQQPGRIVFRTTRPLPPKNGLTVAAAWQKGVVEPPTAGAASAAIGSRTIARCVVAVRRACCCCSPTTPSRGCASAAIRRWAPSSRCSGRRTGCRPPPTRYVDRMSFDNRMFHRRHHQSRRERPSADRRGATARPRSRSEAAASRSAPEEEALMRTLFAAEEQLLLDQTNHEPLGKAKTRLGARRSKRTISASCSPTTMAGPAPASALLVLIVLAVLIAAGYRPSEQHRRHYRPGIAVRRCRS